MPAEAPFDRPAGEAGFTLVEMLVAMLLLSMVGLALARFQTGQLRGSADASLTLAARLVADNIAVDLMVANNAPGGVLAGNSLILGQRLSWTATPKAVPQSLPVKGFTAFDIAVRGTGGSAILASRQVLRPAQWPTPADNKGKAQ